MPTVVERKASLEIIGKSPILFVGRLPFVPVKTKNRLLLNVAKSLSNEAFELSASSLIEMIEFDKKDSVMFKGTWQQVYSLINGEYSRFYTYKKEIYERVKAHRQKCSLAI